MFEEDPFDRKLDLWKGRIPEEVLSSTVFVRDTLALCKAIAESIFGDSPPPHVVFDIYRFVVSEISVPSIEEEPEDPED